MLISKAIENKLGVVDFVGNVLTFVELLGVFKIINFAIKTFKWISGVGNSCLICSAVVRTIGILKDTKQASLKTLASLAFNVAIVVYSTLELLKIVLIVNVASSLYIALIAVKIASDVAQQLID
jgi:hypothetical protein